MASDKVKLIIHSPKLRECEELPRNVRRKRLIQTGKKRSFQDKLLRNSCFACATLLGVLALGNVQQPWAKKTSAAIERALTMEIDLDKSLGQLEFVQKMMPESALVFFNLNAESEFLRPVQAELNHAYSAAQPWLLFYAESGAEVYSPADGTVSAVSPMSGGGYGMLIDHGNGLESVIAGLNVCSAETGSGVSRGGTIGKTEGNLYYELRNGGESIDPSERMGL